MIATAAMPLISMEKPRIEITLTLYKQTEEEMFRTKDMNIKCDEDDKHACERLGISWQPNATDNTQYFIQKANVEISDKDLRCHYLRNPQFSAIFATPDTIIESKILVDFPRSLPACFIERFKNETSVTLHNDLPYEIIVTLNKIKKHNSQPKSFDKNDILSSIAVLGIIALFLHSLSQ
jgi:hypothetical protein